MKGICKCCGRKQDLRFDTCFDCADSESVIAEGLTMYHEEPPKINNMSPAMSKLKYILQKYIGNENKTKGQ